MAVAVAPNNRPPLTDAGKGAKHQPVRAPSESRSTPSAIAPPVPVAADLKGGLLSVAYTETITAQRGTPPYTFAVASGALPAGTALAPATGIISGTPASVGTFTFTIAATDANAQTGSQGFVIVVAEPEVGGGNYGYVG